MHCLQSSFWEDLPSTRPWATSKGDGHAAIAQFQPVPVYPANPPVNHADMFAFSVSGSKGAPQGTRCGLRVRDWSRRSTCQHSQRHGVYTCAFGHLPSPYPAVAGWWTLLHKQLSDKTSKDPKDSSGQIFTWRILARFASTRDW